jgi:short-subunit dehydrogenase
MNYQGKTVWITGASSGIGKAFAHKLFKLGANLILSSRREDALNAVKRDIEEDSPKIKIITLCLNRKPFRKKQLTHLRHLVRSMY